MPRITTVAIALIATVGLATADLCSEGRVEIEGNWFCQPVQAITYTNVGTAGTYNEVVDMANDGVCSSTPFDFTGPIAPLSEEVSFHFRGPLKLKQFAAYAPSVISHKRDATRHRRHGNNHKEFQKRSKVDKEALKIDKRQEVTATIDGKVVSWENNYFGPTTAALSDDTATAPSSADLVTATIEGKVVSWVNNWFGPTATPDIEASTIGTSSDDWVTATIDGLTVSWVNNWFGPTATSSPVAGDNTISATINGQVVSWPNPNAVASPATTPQISSEIFAPQDPPALNAANPGKIAGTVPQPAANQGPVPGPVTDMSTSYERIGYYNSVSQTLDKLVFLGNYGGQGSGVFDYNYGASLSYLASEGTAGASSPQILADCTIPSEHEFTIMTSSECGEDGTCGYVRPGAVAYHGFAGADKVFFIEFEMPMDGMTGFEGNMPAIWALNAKIPRTLQYGNIKCSCWESGCGEFDIVEALNDGSSYLKSTLHDNTPGGDSDYLVRPVSDTMKIAVVFSAASSTLHIQVLPDNTEFSSSVTAGEIQSLCITRSGEPVSLFSITP